MARVFLIAFTIIDSLGLSEDDLCDRYALTLVQNREIMSFA